MTVLAGLRLTFYDHVIGTEGKPILMLDWDARVWLVLESENGYPTTYENSAQVFRNLLSK